MRKKTIRTIAKIILLSALVYGILYAWFSFPIISGYDAKYVCSCHFTANENSDSVIKDLGGFPFSLAHISVNERDSTVTASVWGMAVKKVIYRKGLGCTLVNGMSENELRRQKFSLPGSLDIPSPDWPQGDDINDTVPPGIDTSKLKMAVLWPFTDAEAVKRKTRAVVILYKGQLVGEHYAPGFNKDSKFHGWSMAKSITAAITGILVKQGKLDIRKPAPLEEVLQATGAKSRITTEDLLQQVSGISFKEHYDRYSDVTNMLFNEPDMGAYTLSLGMAGEPGKDFYYSSGNSNIVSRIIRKTVGENEYPSFYYNELFYKTGMYHTVIEPDASGTIVGSSYIMASARDYARFGLLYLQDGIWLGERILPEGWVQQTVTAPACNTNKNYGYQFWLNGLDPRDQSRPAYPGVPADMFYADGFGGQEIYVIPSRQLVIVRLGMKTIDEHRFLKNILDAVR